MVVNGQRNNMCVISGSNWNNAGNARAIAANLNNSRDNSNNNIGFQSDCLSSHRALRIVEIQGCAVRRFAKSTSRFFLVGSVRRSGATQ